MKINEFGKTKNGEQTHLFTLENSNGMKVKVCDYGATLVSLIVPDKDGKDTDIVLGYDNVDPYQGASAFFGANVGRNANRIKGARCIIDGVEYNLESNDGDNGNNLHSGSNCTALKMWKAIYDENVNDKISFEILSKDMEQGFPGNLKQTIRYSLTDKNEFIIDYEMLSDMTTVVNPTNHSYFNLDGHNSGTILKHYMEIYSGQILEIGNDMIPTGRIIDISDTPFDFRKRKQIGKDIDADNPQMKIAGGYDHNYIFQNDRKLRKVAKLYGADSGIGMDVYSDLCGLQFYTGNFLNGQIGKDGAVYKKRSGVCFETQFYPNSCNTSEFPSCILPAYKVFKSRTIYHFFTEYI